MTNLQSDDIEAVKVKFDQLFPRPWGRWLADDTLIDAVAGQFPSSTGFLKTPWRNITKGLRYTYAAWKWLNPRYPLPLDNLSALQASVGLLHVPEREFLSALDSFCTEILRNEPSFEPLENWFRRRLSLLDFRIRPPKALDTRHQTAFSMKLQHLLWALTMANVENIHKEEKTKKALSMAASLEHDCLQECLTIASEVLGSSGVHSFPSGNIMVPIAGKPWEYSDFYSSDITKLNAKSADELWGDWGKDAPKYLVAVAESEGGQYRGFWIPIKGSISGQHLPGAPKAFVMGEGSAVFKSDLPLLEGFPSDVQSRWLGYIQSPRFQDKMFLSIPFVGAGGQVIAVLNINARPEDADGWKRAYHSEWLKIVMERVHDFVDLAFTAVNLQKECGGDAAQIVFATGNQHYNSLLGIAFRPVISDANPKLIE